MKLLSLAVFALGASTLFAQGYESDKPFTFGFKVGVPVTDMFASRNTSLFNGNLADSNYYSSVPRYTFGLSGEFKMPKHLRLEVDGLYKRAGYAASNTGDIFGGSGDYNTKMNVWEIPALLKTNITLGHVRPFIDFGASLRHVSSFQTTGYMPGAIYPTIYNNSPDLHNRNSYGGVAGIGITFKFGVFELSPEARYTRWANQSFAAPGFRTNPFQ